MKLKLCPFCGGEDIRCEDEDTISFYCYECDCQSRKCITIEEAIEAWNRREPIDKVVEQLEEMYKGFCKNLNSDICDIDLCNKYKSCMECFYKRTLEIVKKGGKVWVL